MSLIKSIDDLPVIDAKHSVVLTITKGDISKADIKHPETCAAARACIRGLHAIEARVHLGRVYMRSSKNNWVRYITPKSLRSEIVAFDRGGTFEPGEYILQAPHPTAKVGRGHGGSPMPPRPYKNSGKKRAPYHTITDIRNGPA